MLETLYPNFLSLAPEDSDPDSCGVLVLPLPLDITASWKRGTDAGPRAIISASHHAEYFDDELGFDVVARAGGIATHAEPMLPTDPEAAHVAVLEIARSLVRNDRLLLSLGGEHSVTAPLVMAHRELWDDVCVVQIDAHADMRESYMGSRFNHACPMRRIMDVGIHVTALGVRSMDESERPYLLSETSRIYTAHRVAGRLGELAADIVATLPSDNVYLTIDLDGLDPAVVPAVGTPVPGGLGWYETLAFVRELAAAKNIVGADVVELSPRANLHFADAAAAKLVYKLIAYIAATR